jgi:hypothetical protein
MLERLSDTLQVDYIASLFISDREATRLRSRITTECDWAEIFERDLTDSAARVIESLDFAFTIPIDDELRSTFGGNEAVASVDFNRWTEFGRAVIIELALPFFTWPGIFDDGASHDEAVRVANALNDSDKKLGWQKLGLGAWFAKGSQICFSMALPHTILKPVILGCISSQVADVLFEVINPNAVRKLVRECGRALQATNLESQRDVQEMDSLDSLKRLRKRHGASRASNETLTTNERSHSLWDLASGPLLVYGVFNPVGSTLGSVELIYGVSKNYVAHKFRHPFSPGIEILAEFHGDDEIPSSVIHVIKGLHEKISLPHVVYVPLDLRPDFRNQVIEGLLEVFKNYSESGIDLRKAAERVRDQPNPWWRTEIERGNEKSTGKVSTGELSPWEDYLSTVMNPSLIDYNFALFQGWWEGAWAFQRDPNSPDKATEVVENFTQNVLDRASLD